MTLRKWEQKSILMKVRNRKEGLVFSGAVTFVSRLSLRGVRSPGDKGLELRVEIKFAQRG